MRKHWPEFVDASYYLNMRKKNMEDIKAALEAVKAAEDHMHYTAEGGEFEYNEDLDKAYGLLRDARIILGKFVK